MTLTFLPRGDGRPFLRLDARTGDWLVSTTDGNPQSVDLTGKIVTMHLAGAVQGWLALTPAGADWQPLKTPGAWVDRPSPEHKDGVSTLVASDAWPAPAVREFRGHSRAVNSFIEAVSRQAGAIPAGKAPKLMISGTRSKRYGAGSSVVVEFELAPAESWADASVFDDAHAQRRTQHRRLLARPDRGRWRA